MAIPGTPGGEYTADGLEHAPRGTPSTQAAHHREQLDKRRHKLEQFDYGEDWALCEGDEWADTAVITFGSLTGAARAQERDFCADRPGKGSPPCVLDKGRFQVEVSGADAAFTLLELPALPPMAGGEGAQPSPATAADPDSLSARQGQAMHALLEQVGGAACHEGYRSCFYRQIQDGDCAICSPLVFDPKEVYK